MVAPSVGRITLKADGSVVQSCPVHLSLFLVLKPFPGLITLSLRLSLLPFFLIFFYTLSTALWEGV